MDNLKYFVCEDHCFRIEGTDETEIMDMAKIHIKKMDKVVIKDNELKKMIIVC